MKNKIIHGKLFFVLPIVLFYSLPAYCQENIDVHAALQKTFETEYKAWKKHCESVSFSSKTSDRLKSQHFRNMVALGPKILPFIEEKSLEDKNFQWTGWLGLYITKINPDPTINPWAKESMFNWWKGGRKQTRERFEFLYQKWKNDKLKGDSVETDKTKNSIRALGIATLPFLIEKIKQGDNELIEVVSKLTDGKVKRNATIRQSLDWWGRDKEDWLIPFPNTRSIARAGKDKSIKSGNIVQLDGDASSDADNDTLTYRWTQIAGPSVTLSDNTAAKPVFEAPLVRESTALIFQLVVDDGSPVESVHSLCQSGKSKPDTVRVVVNP
ncbi:MAG: hypothetical protein JW837_00220 [Sedimentisphaerales bacterium]|nr:hypothetical protein [Sedimentisphaerales bacterium]